MQQFNRI